MASLRKRPGSQAWVACYTLPDGTRKQVSTRTTDKHQAQIIATRLEQTSKMVSSGTIDRDWALRIVDEIVSMAGVRLIDPMTPRDLITAFYKNHEATWTVGTKRKYRTAGELFLASIEDFAGRPLAFMPSHMVTKWRDEGLASGRAPKTMQTDLAYLRRVFEEAVARKVISENPFVGVKLPSSAAGKARQKKLPFTWAQFTALIAATDGEWRMFILLAGFTGQRKNDVAKLRWLQVDWAGNCILFKRQKTRDEYPVPLHPDLRRALEKFKPATPKPSDYILPELALVPDTTQASLSERFRYEILPRIGIDQPRRKLDPGSRAREVTAYSIHSLRHMLSTQLNKMGISSETRMLIVGHADARVSAGYTHAALEDAAAAIRKLPSATAPQ